MVDVSWCSVSSAAHSFMLAAVMAAWFGPLVRGAEDVPPAPVCERYTVRWRAGDANGSFNPATVYVSRPRSGPPRTYSRQDGAEYASATGLTMSHSTIVAEGPLVVEVERAEGSPDCTIRPQRLGIEPQAVGPRTVRIAVPASQGGLQLSVEFADDLVTARNDLSGISGTLVEGSAGPAVHTEPRHALVIFVDPPRPELAPTDADGTIFRPAPGRLQNLDTVAADIIAFGPGTYEVPATTHVYLPERVRWLHLEAGAYVRGAFEFRGEQDDYRVTGHGVLSGEHYPYECDRAHGYRSRPDGTGDAHATGLRMLQFFSRERPQRLSVSGITIVNPPYHSMVVFGDEDSFRTTFANYKQVGGWYWQSDGLEVYGGGSVGHSFFHANDDVFKLYHSDTTIENCVVWKGENGPVFQLGWIPRNLHDITVRGIDVIHNRIGWKDVKQNTGIINSARHYSDPGAENKADPGQVVRNVLFEDIRCEGMSPVALRLYPLSSWKNVVIRNLSIERWNELPLEAVASHLKPGWNPDRSRRADVEGLRLENYRVGGEPVSLRRDNWRHDQAGRLDFDGSQWGKWDAVEAR